MDTILSAATQQHGHGHGHGGNNTPDYPAIYQYILLGALLFPFIIIRVIDYILYRTEASRIPSSSSNATTKPSPSSSAEKINNRSEEGNTSSRTQRHLFVRLYDTFYAFVAAPLNTPFSKISYRSKFKILIFGIFIIVNIVFCVKANPTSSPTLKRISQNTGLMAYANLPLLFLLATRNNLLAYITGKPYQHFRSFHILLGSLVAILAIIHSICYSVLESQRGRYMQLWREHYWKCGVVATCAMTILTLTPAILFLRKRFYELFFLAHVAGAAIVLAGCYYHRPQIELCKWIITSICIWGLDRSLRYAQLIFNHSSVSLSSKPVKFSRAIVNARHVSDAIVLDVQKVNESTSSFPSSHIYISFLGKKLLLNHPTLLAQNHPFSVISSFPTPVPLSDNSASSNQSQVNSPSSSAPSFPETPTPPSSQYSHASEKEKTKLEKIRSSSMRLIIRSRDGITRLLQEEIICQNNNSKSEVAPEGEKVATVERESDVARLHALIEGPYGSIDFNWKSYDTVALFAAGTGISHIFGIFTYLCHEIYADNAGKSHCKNSNKIITTDIHLTWVFRYVEELYWISDYLLDILSFASTSSFLSIKINLYVTQPQSHSHHQYIQSLSINDDIRKLDRFNASYSSSPSSTSLSSSSTSVQFFYGRRPDITKEIYEIVHSFGNRVQLHVCGPSSFDTSVRTAASKVSSTKEAFAGRGVVHVVSEPFE